LLRYLELKFLIFGVFWSSWLGGVASSVVLYVIYNYRNLLTKATIDM